MGLRYTTCLDPNDMGSELNENLIYKTSKLSALQSYYEYSYSDEDGEDGDIDGDGDGDGDEDDDEVSNTNSNGSRYSSFRISRLNPFFRMHQKYNDNGRAITYACSHCLTHVSASNLIISDRYHGATGDALLIYDAVNIQLGPSQMRRMTTGVYTVCELLCRQCGKYLGWKYIKSSDPTQKFKEGRYILEVDLVKEVKS
ncbi:hypothetical protein FOA43_003256 [Brettanomyces nanus]|uniref:Yippee domain-containing protein n=1 Tax=Eeniella nana TaxID=13502 RepID=A0A875RQ47_EENNA|nr:uncharacterized protein FOA43_003256 [Brettanomyces nanus]QPG75870.1 hypothetical protein FOA43_003256 [Brettanomyces nanus]